MLLRLRDKKPSIFGLWEVEMKTKVSPIPEGYHTLTPYLTVSNAADLIEFYKKAFGAEERFRMPTPDGKKVVHAELKIGDSIFMLSDEIDGMECKSPLSFNGTPVGFYVYVKDVDAAFKRAVDAGAVVKSPVEDMFWGDRIGSVSDPSGHVWSFATHVEELTPEEIEKRGQEFFQKMA
jgi:PhnB protein